MVCIGVVGDYEPTNETHVATTAAVQHAGTQLRVSTQVTWVPTDLVEGDGEEVLARLDGLIIAPGSPYRSLGGALTAFEHARVHDVALLGTCGGFQHVVLEFARNVVGFEDAQHAEYDPYASTLFITPLSCSLAGQTMTVHVKEGTRTASAYQRSTVTERYYCNFGLNPSYLDTIVRAGLTVSGTDQAPGASVLRSDPFRTPDVEHADLSAPARGGARRSGSGRSSACGIVPGDRCAGGLDGAGRDRPKCRRRKRSNQDRRTPGEHACGATHTKPLIPSHRLSAAGASSRTIEASMSP